MEKLNKNQLINKEMEHIPSKEEVIGALLCYARLDKEYNNKNCYNVVTYEEIVSSIKRQLKNNPSIERKEELEAELESEAEMFEYLKKMKEEVETAKGVYEDLLKVSGLTEEDKDINAIFSDASRWQ